MIVKQTSLHPVARDALKEIQAAGITITPEIVVWVDGAAKRIASHPPRPASDLVDWPTFVGGVALYPLTYGAMAWLKTLPKMYQQNINVVAFAMAHAKKPEVFTGRPAMVVLRHIIPWVRDLKCSREALEAAVMQANGIDSDVVVDGGRDPSGDWHFGAIALSLTRRYPGTTPAYWLWEASQDMVESAIHSINSEMPEDDQITDWEKQSNFEFRAIVDHIKAGKHKEATNG